MDVDRIYTLVKQGQTQIAVRTLFAGIDNMLVEDRFDECNQTIQTMDLRRLNISLFVALLAITLRAKDKLPYRQSLYQEIKGMLEKEAPDRIDNLLCGLE